MIKVDIKKGFYVQTHPRGRVTARYDKVLLAFGNNKVEFTTPVAHKLGFALIRKELECEKDCYIILTVNNVDVHLLPKDAKRIGVGLLIQSDHADDFQRALQ